MDVARLKQRVCARVDELAPALIATSHEIHAHPELCYEEHFAHDLLTALLEREGAEVAPGAYGLATAFDARAGGEGPTVVVCCEYDALPGIGHACGHNVIAAATAGAGLAAAAVAEEAGGRVRVLGTPAEEGGAGKVELANRGALDGVDAAMMVHPAGADLATMDSLAAAMLEVEYFGEAAHAAAAPQRGRNALDAAVLGYMNVAALRQHIADTDRVHGVFTKGGDKANIVPDHTAMGWMVRSARAPSLDPLKARVLACFDAGALATGCSVRHRFVSHDYAEMVDNPVLIDLYAANSANLGRPLSRVPGPADRVVGSTDMGNVSYLVPSIHPMIKVSPSGISIHSAEFARHAGSPAGDQAVIDGAKALAMTITDLWVVEGALDRVKAAFAPPASSLRRR
ncbi:MAG TPA: M20 family metallopeptidase [Acidimicrobiales bacterium]|nr:M20 family metallopeptidase [Acidimicrobiales bacterium]